MSASSWLAAREKRDPVEAVRFTVAALVRARHWQRTLELLWLSLFVSLVVAAIAVGVVRIFDLQIALAPLVIGLLLAGSVLALGIAGWRRPGRLRAAIEADLKLNLKQQLSTACEFIDAGSDDDTQKRLARQALRARLPTRPELVFPLRLNAWGRLVPAAALLLVLAAVVDLPADGASPPAVDDSGLRREGTRLREYAQAMEERAAADALQRSRAQAQAMQRLAARMESGSLNRPQALDRLRDLRDELDAESRSALAEGEQVRVDGLRMESLPSSSAPMPRVAGMSAREFLDRLLDGELAPSDLRDLGQDAGRFERFGISREALERAREQFAAGDRQQLEELLRSLSDREQRTADVQELDAARDRVDRARENLGDSRSEPDSSDPAIAGAHGDDAGDFGAAPEMGPDDGVPGEGGSRAMRGGVGAQGESAAGNQRTPSSSGESTVVLQPRGRIGEGKVFVSEARVLPRASTPEQGTAELPARYRAQLEAVLSRDDVPLRHRALVRRYFLNLSVEGAEGPER